MILHHAHVSIGNIVRKHTNGPITDLRTKRKIKAIASLRDGQMKDGLSQEEAFQRAVKKGLFAGLSGRGA